MRSFHTEPENTEQNIAIKKQEYGRFNTLNDLFGNYYKFKAQNKYSNGDYE